MKLSDDPALAQKLAAALELAKQMEDEREAEELIHILDNLDD